MHCHSRWLLASGNVDGRFWCKWYDSGSNEVVKVDPKVLWFSWKFGKIKKMRGQPNLILPLRGLILHRMLPKDVFEASFLLLSHYPELVFRKIANTFNWKTTHYSWLKQLLNPLSSPFYLYEGNFLPPQLTAMALFQHINTCNFSRSLQISLKFSVNITEPPRSWIMCKNI